MRLIVKDWIKFAVSRSRLRCAENDGQLPDSRLERENCFLTLPVCDKMWRVASTWRWLSTILLIRLTLTGTKFDHRCCSSICSFQEKTTNAPRLDWKITVLLHLPRPTLTLDLASGKKFVSSGTSCNVGVSTCYHDFTVSISTVLENKRLPRTFLVKEVKDTRMI